MAVVTGGAAVGAAFSTLAFDHHVAGSSTTIAALVHAINMGLTDLGGVLPLHDNTASYTNSLLAPDQAADETWGSGEVKSKGTVLCAFDTLDNFVAERGIQFIDILKLDTQGTETRILDGAKACLASKKIGLVYSEIII